MTTKMIPVTEDFCMMLNWAVRYALGRRTYAVYSTCSYITPIIICLTDKTLNVMREDIIRQEAFGYGDDCDKEDWMNLLDTIETEMRRRGMAILKGEDAK